MKKALMITVMALLASSLIFASISADEAKRIAFDHAGVNEKDVSGLRVDKEREDGFRVYDVRFWSGRNEYDYEIGVEDGEIYSFNNEIREKVVVSKDSSGSVSQSDALLIALNDAGLSEKDASRVRNSKDYDDGFTVFEIEFRGPEYDYEYEIDAESGAILLSDLEVRGRISSNRGKDLISLEKAESLMKEFLPEFSIDDFSVWKEYDDGLYIYEGKGYIGDYEYEITLDASTGKLLSLSRESLDRW